ncbi:MBL fold metallo-hydrolase [Piscinibacter sp.]|uniref:MBL fold metallo-hydrolase n=1 Tax=Piscinibacter sp. TaxID=1903157 RepID=UPI002D7F378D|nr:MBL fold metallo-hydrolase [Albitalea sp.]
MLPTDAFLQTHGDGIHVVDTGFHRPHFDAAYLIVEDGRAAFVDTGTNHALPRLLAALEALRLGRDQVDWVIPTHVHLDHAGGAGLLMRELPRARMAVHPRGERHMVNPARLMASARAVYGDKEVARSYGEVVGVAPERVVATHDGMTLNLAGRALRFLDTPGHARHHHCIWDERSGGFFTGDTFGLSYREFDTEQGAFMLPTSTPVQFEPDALRHSVLRMLAMQPRWMYLTHYGPVDDVQRLGKQLLDHLDAMVALGQSVAAAADRHRALTDGLSRIYLERLRRHGCTMDDSGVLELLAMDIELNAQGIAIWLDRLVKR